MGNNNKDSILTKIFIGCLIALPTILIIGAIAMTIHIIQDGKKMLHPTISDNIVELQQTPIETGNYATKADVDAAWAYGMEHFDEGIMAKLEQDPLSTQDALSALMYQDYAYEKANNPITSKDLNITYQYPFNVEISDKNTYIADDTKGDMEAKRKEQYENIVDNQAVQLLYACLHHDIDNTISSEQLSSIQKIYNVLGNYFEDAEIEAWDFTQPLIATEREAVYDVYDSNQLYFLHIYFDQSGHTIVQVSLYPAKWDALTQQLSEALFGTEKSTYLTEEDVQ